MSTSKAVPAKRRRKGITPIERAAGAEPEAVAASEQAEACPSLSHDPRLWTARERVRAWAARTRMYQWMILHGWPELASELTAALVEVWLLAWADLGVPIAPGRDEAQEAIEQLHRWAPVRAAEVAGELHERGAERIECESCGRRLGRRKRYCGRCRQIWTRTLVGEGWTAEEIRDWCDGGDGALRGAQT